MLNSIRARLTVVFVSSITVLVILFSMGSVWYAHRSAEKSADRILNETAKKISREMRAVNGHEEVSELAEDTANLSPDNIAFMVVDPSGKVLLASQRRVPSWPRRDDGWRVATATLGSNILVVGLPWKDTEQALRRQASLLAAFGMMVVLSSAVGAWLLVGWTLSPIGSLARQAQSESADKWPVRLVESSKDMEVVELVSTLNDLLKRQAEAAASRGRFYLAASHELRTPLQALSGHLEVALSRERTNEEYRSAICEANRQSRRLISLAQDLLTLNRLESAPRQQCEVVGLADVCERVLNSQQPILEGKQLHLVASMPENNEILAPLNHAEMLVRNLIENAVKYATPGGEVRVSLSSDSTGIVLDIFNTSEPLSSETVTHLFEPFYRPDVSRDSKTGGNGLGLAICRAVATANGWDIDLQPNPAGFRVTVRIGKLALHS